MPTDSYSNYFLFHKHVDGLISNDLERIGLLLNFQKYTTDETSRPCVFFNCMLLLSCLFVCLFVCLFPYFELVKEEKL